MSQLSEAHIELLEKHHAGLLSKEELINALASDYSEVSINQLITDFQTMQDVIVWDAIKSNPDLVSASKYLQKKNGKLYWILGSLLCSVALLCAVIFSETDNNDPVQERTADIEAEQPEQSHTLIPHDVSDTNEVAEIEDQNSRNDEDDFNDSISNEIIPLTVNDTRCDVAVVVTDDHAINSTTDNTVTTNSTNQTIIDPCKDVVIKTSVAIMEPCEGENNGTLSFNSSGGEPPYQFILDDENFNNTVNYIGMGSYELVTTDVNGCVSTQDIEVSEKVCTKPMNTVYSLSTTNGDYIDLPEKKGTFSVINSNGQVVYRTLTGTPQQWKAVNNQGAFLPTGAYTFIFQSEGEVIKGEINIIL